MAYTEYAVYRSQMATHSALNRYRTVPPINSESPNGKEDNEENETGDENNENDEQLRSSDEDEQLDIVEEDDEQFDSLDAYRDRYSRLHRDGTKPEDIFPELKKVARRLHAMMSENDFSNTATQYHVLYIYQAYVTFRDPREEVVTFGRLLAETEFVESFQLMLKYGVKGEVYEEETDDNRIFRNCLRNAMSFTWNLSDKSLEFCEKIISTGFYKDIFEYLSSKTFSPENLDDNLKVKAIQGQLGSLHNIVQKAKNAREVFRQCDAVDVLQKFREASEHQMISCVALMIQSYLVTEDENEKINSGSEVFELLVKLLDNAINKTTYNGLSFAPIEVLEALNNLAVNDSNKQRIVECGALPYYVQLMSPECSEVEQSEAAHGIWTLAFNAKCKDRILKEDGCIDALKLLAERTQHESVKKNADGALWILRDESPQHAADAKSQVTGDSDAGHVFISYQWDAKPTVLRLRDRLRSAGFKVWIDEDDMSGSVLEAMALAVEKAVVVLVCLSQKYKESPSCRTEAEYTFRLRKPYIPLRLQQGYYPDGWLGALAGSKLVFDLSVPTRYEDSVKHLIKELGSYTQAGSDVVDGIVPTKASITQTMQPTHEKSSPINSWKTDDVRNWFEKNDIAHLQKMFEGFDGPALRELQCIRHEAPDSFFSYLTKEGVNILDQTRLSRALRDL